MHLCFQPLCPFIIFCDVHAISAENSKGQFEWKVKKINDLITNSEQARIIVIYTCMLKSNVIPANLLGITVADLPQIRNNKIIITIY